ncbi:MAG TPA: PD-(D/E)XK nuclease superfamily protein [Coleofasciculaceae cyanobacterium]
MIQGARAAKFGNNLERTVEGILQAQGYSPICPTLPKKQRRNWLLCSNGLQKQYARHVYIGSGIYGTDIYVDFLIIGSSSYPTGLIIECKWQQSSGSVDEKLPYLNLNIQDCYPAPAIVVIDGQGMKPGAINWLTRQVGLNPQLIAVYDLTHFMIWANKNL